MWDRIQQGLWWDKTLSLVSGCTKVSPGCDHCWAEMETRVHAGKKDEKSKARYSGLLTDSGWNGEIREMWRDLAKITDTQKPLVYTVWNDLFHPGVSFSFQQEVFTRFKECPQHTFIICTKRPEIALAAISSIYANFRANSSVVRQFGGSLPNVIIMTTVEDQKQADIRIPLLLQIPAAKRALSVEPMLGPVNLTNIIWGDPTYKGLGTLSIGFDCRHENHNDTPFNGKKIDWVVCGGESGKDARPVHPDWVRFLRDQCIAAEVEFMFKSWGNWWPAAHAIVENRDMVLLGNEAMYNVGKKNAGRLLDGRTWDEHPV